MRTGQPTLATPAYSEFDLTVSCGSATYCVALSDDTASVWNGTSWSAFHAVGKNYPSFEWISCAVGTQVCVATGEDDAIVFHGSTWQTVPRPAGADLGYLSCASATFCVSVGYEVSYVYNGTKWVDAPKPATLEGSFGDASVSCVSSTFCLAMDPVGNVGRFDGTAWHAAAAFKTDHFYGPLSCTSTTECVVVGTGNTVIEYKNGSFGSEQPTTVTPSTGDLADVSCVSATWCMAVDGKGNAVRGGGTGAWSAPRRIDTASAPSAVDCPSTTKCVVVDNNGRVLTWNGTGWSAPMKISHALYGISCPTTKMCVAAGRSSMVLDHGKWTKISPPANSYELNAVTCLRTTYCVAAGSGGFFSWHHRTWSRAIGHVPNGVGINVACSSDLVCQGVEDDTESVDLAKFAGAAAILYSAEGTNYPVTSCVPNSVCVTVSDDLVVTSR